MKNSRRDFIKKSFNAAVVTGIGSSIMASPALGSCSRTSSVTAFQFQQIPLPYNYAALEPYIDAQTMEIHYTKHHTAYLKNVNEAILAEKITAENEQDIFKNMAKHSAKIRNNAGGVYNHNFFWLSMKPGESSSPSGKILEALNSSFGDFEKFKQEFTQAAMTRFGSGWAWLIRENGKLKVTSTPNQDNPLMDLPAGQGTVSDGKGTPLLALDVWEHAYYLKYQNKRNEYISNWWNVVNWDEVSKRLG